MVFVDSYVFVSKVVCSCSDIHVLVRNRDGLQ